MRVIVLKEKDITKLLNDLKFQELKLKGEHSREQTQFISNIHRKFHFEMVRFFQEQGSTYPGN